MAQNERYAFRDSAYSAWHRIPSIRRFVGIEKARSLSMIDIDAMPWVEYDDDNGEPLALIETAADVNQPHKCGKVLTSLAKKANIPCYVVLYRCTNDVNPGCESVPDIVEFKLRRTWPNPSNWVTLSPSRYANGLLRLRAQECRKLDLESGFDPFIDEDGK